MNNTLKLQVKVSGDGNPIVLVPGGLTGWKSWEPFTEIFSSQKRKVVQVQLLSVEYGIENRQLPDKYTVHTESQALESHSIPLSIMLRLTLWHGLMEDWYRLTIHLTIRKGSEP